MTIKKMIGKGVTASKVNFKFKVIILVEEMISIIMVSNNAKTI